MVGGVNVNLVSKKNNKNKSKLYGDSKMCDRHCHRHRCEVEAARGLERNDWKIETAQIVLTAGLFTV